MSEQNITVSEDRLRAILAEFKLDLIERLNREIAHKADIALVAALEKRMTALEEHGSRDARMAIRQLEETERVIEGLMAWRNRMIGAIAVLSAAVVPVSLIVLTHYLP